MAVVDDPGEFDFEVLEFILGGIEGGVGSHGSGYVEGLLVGFGVFKEALFGFVVSGF